MLCVLKEKKILAVFLDHQNTGIPYTSNTVAICLLLVAYHSYSVILKFSLNHFCCVL